MATILGTDLMLFVDNEPIAYSTSAKLSVSVNAEDVTSKDSGDWEESELTKFNWTASTDALFSVDGGSSGNKDMSELWTAFINKTEVAVTFAIKDGTSPNWTPKSGTNAFVGTAQIVKLDVNADVNGVATYSIELKGKGKLEMQTIV